MARRSDRRLARSDVPLYWVLIWAVNNISHPCRKRSTGWRDAGWTIKSTGAQCSKLGRAQFDGETGAMIDLHYWTTPNGHKITIFLEESGLPYRIIPVNIGKGERFKADFLVVSHT